MPFSKIGENILFWIINTTFLLIVKLVESVFTIVTLIYFIGKVFIKWLFYYEKPVSTYTWWRKRNSPLYICISHKKFTEMKFEKIGELWAIKINNPKWLAIKGPNSPFGIILFLITIPFAVGMMHMGADHPLLNFFRFSGVIVYAIWITFIEFKLMFWGWGLAFEFLNRKQEVDTSKYPVI